MSLINKQYSKLTAQPVNWILFALSLALIIITLYLIFMNVPTDANLGISQRIFYIHVPIAWLGMISIVVVAIASALYLWTKNNKWDDLAYSTAEYGIIFATLIYFASGCSTPASKHRADIRDDSGDRITVGKVQREVKIGMPSSAIVEILGSPNVVTTDEKRREVWVYDKVASERIASSSASSIFLFFGDQGQAASSSSQRTLTIIIKFDESSLVRDFAYHTSRF